MNRILLSFFLFSGITTSLFAQNYSYSFKGSTDSISVQNIARELSGLEGVETVKGRYKAEKMSGEFLIFTTADKNKANPYPFDPTKIKAILIENDLSPLNFKEIPTK